MKIFFTNLKLSWLISFNKEEEPDVYNELEKGQEEKASEIEMLKQYLDSSNSDSSSTGRGPDITLYLKRKKSKTLSTLSSSYKCS